MLNLDTHVLVHALAGELTRPEAARLRDDLSLVTRDARLRRSRLVPLAAPRRD